MRAGSVTLFSSLVAAATCFAQPPPNDDFANRIPLVGSSIVFTGSLAGATQEVGENTWGGQLTGESVWWTWTSDTHQQVIIRFLDYLDGDRNGIEVRSGTDLPALNVESSSLIDGVPFRSVAFEANSGVSYQIRLVSSVPGPYVMELMATNVPLVLSPPRTRTVSSNEPVLFAIVAAGKAPLTYQWQHEGTNLPNQNVPALRIEHATPSTIGAYAVVVSNAFGCATSSVAQLNISEFVIRPQLVVAPAQEDGGKFSFSLMGEIGRAYLIENSTDLGAWSPQGDWSLWPTPSSYSAPTSVVINSNIVSTYSVVLGAGSRFFRAAIHEPYKNPLCLINLKRIMLAKHEWAREAQQTGISTPTVADLAPFVSGDPAATSITSLACPEDTAGAFSTSYSINAVDTGPTCQIVPLYDWLKEPVY